MKILPRLRNGIAALTATLLVGACSDAPTTPAAMQQIAGGEAWIAVPAPEGLPDLATWTPLLGQESGARTRVEALSARAKAARLDGDLEHAAALEREAVGAAIRFITVSPDPELISRAMDAIAQWRDAVGEDVDPRVYPQVAATHAAVGEAMAAAEAALTDGDTVSALLRISDAAAGIREHTPEAVALRVLSRAESQLRASGVRGPVLDRAVHLIRSARHELVDGDPSRALRRALYALQLAEGV